MLNYNYLKNISRGEKKIENELLLLLEKSSQKFLTAAKTAVEKNDMAAWKFSLHEFKGGAASLGAAKVLTLCEEAEKNQNQALQPLLLASLEEEVKALIIYINDYMKSA